MKTINIKGQFADDWITRQAGERLRNLIVETTKSDTSVEIDFSGVTVASTSFFDEGFAKLAESGWTAEKMKSLVKLKNINKRDREILEDLFRKRERK